MNTRSLGSALGVGLVLSLVGTARAHPVTVDGDTSTDWFARAPAVSNQGIVARNASSEGELVWDDATGEARTDLVDPEQGADIASMAITADATNLYVRVEAAGPIVPGSITTPVPQIQVAIDLDRTASSGEQFLAGFADTTVSPDAYWEYLIQTQATSGLPEVQVLDTSFASTGMGTAVIVGSTLELSIPWSLLGLSGPPSVARFSVASFRENPADGNTLDIGGSGISNAVDVISDYGDPSPGPSYANTFAGEVSDGVVDYYFDVWFDAAGEVYAPLQIASYLYHAGTYPELVAVRNQTGSSLELERYAVGDEEDVDAGEGMMSFPASSLAAGGDFVVALDGSTGFTSAFGVAPDAEATDDDAVVPDMVDLSTYATGSINLANGGDHVIVLGVGRVILDVATYGGESYPGITDSPTAGSDQVTVRDPIGQDTDDGSDFRVGDACDGDAACGTCSVCDLFACGPAPTGTTCDDADACTTGDSCDASGACAGSSLACDDGNPCTADSCDPSTGCENTPVGAGTSCSDGDACNGDETCDGSGTCTAGTPLDCDDSNACTIDTCDAVAGCDNTPDTGATCDDGDACTSGDTCDASGSCVGGATVACDDANPCTTDSCDSATGCVFADVSAGTSCADGDVCNGDETCDGSGTCTAGTPLDCDDANACTVDACDATSGCSNTPDTGATCDDSDMCTTGEACDTSGACTGGAAVDCDDGNPCTADACDAATGCSHTDVASGTSCDDDDPCTASTVCDGSGACGGGTIDPSCVDAGMPDAGALDAGTDEDAGAVMEDAGTPDEDAGADEDAGPEHDAAVGLDGSVPFPDAATADGGMDDMDDGGCSCRVGAPRSGGLGGALATLALVGLALFRRRRRR